MKEQLQQLEAAGAGRGPLFPRPSPPEPQVMPERETGRAEEEYNDDDVEGGAVPTCRVCLESNCEPGDELISPCMCKGTHQFVHRQCLDHWRSVKEGFAFSNCTTCMAQFHLRVAVEEDNNSSWRKAKFQLFIIRDVLVIFVTVQTMIAVMGGIAYLIVKNGAFKNSFDDNWNRIISKHPIPFFYFIGVLVFFVIVGVVGLIMDISSLCSDNRETAGPHLCCYGGGSGDCCPDSIEAACVLVGIFLVFFAILGLPYGFLAATMTFQKIWQRHYHILAKKELTKVYIVEDLHGCYSPPKLDPEHEERLKMMLKLPLINLGRGNPARHN